MRNEATSACNFGGKEAAVSGDSLNFEAEPREFLSSTEPLFINLQSFDFGVKG